MNDDLRFMNKMAQIKAELRAIDEGENWLIHTTIEELSTKDNGSNQP